MPDLETHLLREVASWSNGTSQHSACLRAMRAVGLNTLSEADCARMAGVLSGLVFARELNRTVSGEGSGRCYYLHLTGKGRAALKETP